MFHREGMWRWRVALGLTAAVLLSIAGCPSLVGPQGPTGPTGPTGAQGPTGATGPAGAAAGAPLSNTNVTITGVSGASPVAVGGPISVTFTLEDDNGDAIAFTDLDRFSIYVSGPSSNYQRVIIPEPANSSPTTAAANITTNADGSYTYRFANPFPSVYAAPVNKPAGAAPVTGELTGQAVTAGTYTVGIEARRALPNGTTVVEKAGDATFDFVIGGATLSPRQVVTQTNCNQCHTSMSVHGDNRHLLTGCVLCHTNGALDSASAVSIQLSDLIHQLHRGADLPGVAATAKGTNPLLYQVSGFRGSINNFSDIEFPWMPGGTGFNQQTRNCYVCHGGASQGAIIYANQNLTKARCSTCHDDIDFTTGTILDPNNPTVKAGTLTQAQLPNTTFRINPGGIGGSPGSGTQHKFSDTFDSSGNNACALCHATGQGFDINTFHVAPLADPTKIIGLKTLILSVTGNSGVGFFAPGDKPVVVFQLLDANNTPVPIDNVASISFLLSGPVENYQKILAADPNTAALTIKSTTATNCTPATGTGPFTYVAATAIPANFPTQTHAQANNFPFTGGWGNLGGKPLISGSYTIAVWAYRNFIFENNSYRETSPPGLAAARIGSAGALASYSGIVTDAKCNACHGDLRFHGNGRKSVTECVLCHTAGAEDGPTPAAGQTQDPANDTIDMKVMIHKIHDAQNLTVVLDGGKYDLVGNGGNVSDFSTDLLPTMPDGPKHCVACHATDAWFDPIPNANVNVWKVACTSCHDSASTAVHAQLNTLGVGQEGCEVCHGVGKLVAVQDVHATP